MIWAAVAWPFIAGAISVTIFNRRVTPLEAISLLVLPLAVIWYLNEFGEVMVTNDVEYRTAPIVNAIDSKAWTARVPCQHWKKTKRGKVAEHKAHKFKHKASTFAYLATGEKIKITRKRFEHLCSRFGNKKGHKVNTNYSNPRGKEKWVSYVTRWGEKESDLEVATTAHKYVNRIPASHSNLTYQQDKHNKWIPFDYPKIKNSYEAPALLGLDAPLASRRLDVLNAKLGPANQVRAMILVFVDKPREAALAQESYWQGGNSNEFIICVGVDDQNRVKWSHIFSWTDKEDLKIEARNIVAKQKGDHIDFHSLLDWMEENLHRFERKSFSEFDYLNVTPPFWYVLLAHVLIAIITWSWFYFAVVKPNRK